MSYSDENKPASLALLLSQYDYVILDTCSLMDDGFPAWMDTLEKAKDYLRKDEEIYVPSRCVEELEKHSKNEESDSKRIAAIRALKILKLAKKNGLLTQTKQGKNKNFADNVIYTQVSQDRITKKILVITSDKGLATDLTNLNNLVSQHGYIVGIYKINAKGELTVNKGETHPVQTQRVQTKRNTTPKAKPAEAAPESKPARLARKNDADELANRLLSDDKRIRANITNPNYPKEKKLEDLKAQLSSLRQLTKAKREALAITFTEAKLLDAIRQLENGDTYAAKKAEPAPKKAEPKPAPKPEPKPEEPKEAPKKEKIWYEDGPNLLTVISRLSAHHGFLFRDPSIPFVSGVHGAIDLTKADLTAIVEKGEEALKKSDSVDFVYKNKLAFHFEKKDKGIRGTVEIKAKPAKKAPKKKETKPKEETPKEQPAPSKPEEAPKPKRTRKPKAKPQE